MNIDLTLVNERSDLLGALAINSAAEGNAGSEDFLDSAGELDSHGLCSHLLSDFNDVVHLEVAVVLDVLLLLPVSGTFLEGLNDERSSSGQDCNEALSVLDHHFDLNLDSSPVHGGLLDVFSDLLGRHTKRTALGSQSGGTGDFTTYHFQVDYKPRITTESSLTELLLVSSWLRRHIC